MVRSSDYAQLGIGVCGHVVHTWPQICDLGGGNPSVICEDCTRISNQLPDSDGLHVWVFLKPKPSPVKPRVSKPKKEKPLSKFNALLQQEGLL